MLSSTIFVMKNEFLVLKFRDKPTEYSFGNKVSFVDDKRLNLNLSKRNYRNSGSELVIHSSNDTHISDVVQIKINLSETGAFNANFQKEELDASKREELLKEISSLKSEDIPTLESQIEKIKKLILILNKYEPIFVSFSNSGDIKIDYSLISDVKLCFPLLVVQNPFQNFVIKFKRKTKVKKDEPEKVKEKTVQKKEYPPLSLFEFDYLFILLFALLGTSSITTTIFEIMNKQAISIFLGIISLAFVIVEAIAMQSSTYKRNKLINPYIRYYLAIYIAVGITIGIILGYFVSKGLLKTEIEGFNYQKMWLISLAISAPALISSLFSSILVNQITIKLKKNK